MGDTWHGIRRNRGSTRNSKRFVQIQIGIVKVIRTLHVFSGATSLVCRRPSVALSLRMGWKERSYSHRRSWPRGILCWFIAGGWAVILRWTGPCLVFAIVHSGCSKPGGRRDGAAPTFTGRKGGSDPLSTWRGGASALQWVVWGWAALVAGR